MPNLNTQAFLIPYADTGNRKNTKNFILSCGLDKAMHDLLNQCHFYTIF